MDSQYLLLTIRSSKRGRIFLGDTCGWNCWFNSVDRTLMTRQVDCVTYLEQSLNPHQKDTPPDPVPYEEPDEKAISNLEKLWKNRPLKPPTSRPPENQSPGK